MKKEDAVLPSTQTALVALSECTYTIAQRHCLPKQPPLPQDIIVRVTHVALNPCNWKMIDFSPAIGTVGGNDFSGEVVIVGSHVQRWNVGDAVCGFLYGLDPHAGKTGWAGAFAQYVSVDEGLVMRVSPSLGNAQAACLGAGIVTAGMSLFRSLGLPSIGVPAGYLPLTTCSLSNFNLVKSFGAEKAFDYHSPSCGVAIRAFTKGKLQKALDCITDSSSMKICYTAIGPRGGQYTALEPPPEHIKQSRKDIRTDWVMALTIFGKAVDLKGPFERAAAPGDMEWARSWYMQADGLVASGILRPHPAKVTNGNWTDVIQGIDDLRNGKVRGVKLVYGIE
ncbi:alcohol dehydrogenase [Beauveria bassiana ARSEF 2860]|uniref:Alcohol dehydrogenase n=1 Tax=Beauveria bassiana (strain ARSEF 2860) TaxID=655819 RepID=J5J341_BEAB2|nr:alcohol dehydrogenase [Beauveria bassiana ARSEF 2860]EJP61203.1 alcohol dehydrogenase [Beauveria bassiana ARSEF 2860]